jgi:hypothetical protein
MISKSQAYELEQATDGTVTIKNQESGFAQGLMNEAMGVVNGGKTGSVGLSHTVAAGALVAAGAKFKDKLTQIPLVGGALL